MKTNIITHIDQQFLDEWKQLWLHSPYANYFNGPQWFLSLLETFTYENYVLVALYNKEKLVGVGAFVKEKRFGLDVYTVAPNDFVCGEPFLLDYQNEAIIKSFVEAINTLGAVYLENVPETIVSLMQNAIPSIKVNTSSINLYFTLHKDDHDRVLIPKRSRLTNRIKECAEDFTTKFFDGNMDKGLDTVFSIDKQSSKESKGYSTFSDPEIKTLYKNLAKQLKDHFSVAILYFKEKPIAYYIGFIVNDVYYWSQNAYILAYGQYSPGKILLVNIIDHLGSVGVKKVDFGPGDYRMKRLLTNDFHTLYSVIIAEKIFTRRYIASMKATKNYLYEKMYNQGWAYSFYRKMKNIFR